jgi:HD superfamily phosphohydrolase
VKVKEKKTKLFKDPIYGYIEVPGDIASQFIDTACFQRLRRIVQTSYTPLYSAALHNRFIHSLGVYHLGKIAFKNAKEFLLSHKEILRGKNIAFIDDKFEELFSIACLLHDVGHAPFSHNGEGFYENCTDKNGKTLFEQLCEVVGVEEFSVCAKKKETDSLAAAPHEKMSVIVALRSFKNYFEDKDKDFFARCILGYKYAETDNPDNEIKNCFISMLNSSIIDVDRLDYAIRDSFVSGYQNVSIDFARLLHGFIIAYVEQKKQLDFVYHKNALSIIEHVIFARDSEQKWMQNHPIVLYENYLVKYSIGKVQQYFSDRNKQNDQNWNDQEYTLFKYEALTKDGNGYGKDTGLSLSFFSDDDIIFFVKNVCGDDITQEYFDRGKRRHSLWKSEAEYMHLLEQYLPLASLDKPLSIFADIKKKLEKLLGDESSPSVMDEITLKKIRNELEATESEIEKSMDEKKDLNPKKTDLSNLIRQFGYMQKFAEEFKIEFSFLIIFTNKFKSNFSNLMIDDISIWFPLTSATSAIKDVSPFLKAAPTSFDERKQTPKEIFYFYYKGNAKRADLQKAFFSKLFKNLQKIDS